MVEKERSRTLMDAILRYQLLGQLQLAAEDSGYYLKTKVNSPKAGQTKVLFDDGRAKKKVWIRAVKGFKGKLRVHKNFLRPSSDDAAAFGFPAEPEGSQGGIICIDYKYHNSSVDTFCYYTDIFIITAVEIGGIETQAVKDKESLQTVLYKLRQGASNDLVALIPELFVAVKSPAHLLSLMQLNSEIQRDWALALRKLAKFHHYGSDCELSSKKEYEKLKASWQKEWAKTFA